MTRPAANGLKEATLLCRVCIGTRNVLLAD
jgi:hypothetical protein